MAKMGAPRLELDEAIAEDICTKIATHPYGIRRLRKENPHWPNVDTIFQWRLRYPNFAERYANAKRHQIECLVDEIIDIADNDAKDSIVRVEENGTEKVMCNSEWINRSRLRIDTRKWLAAKLAPKIYGEKASDKASEEDAISKFRVDE
jgi:hypothetical protein